MRIKLLLILTILTFRVFSQKRELSYSLSNGPVFLNKAGQILGKATLGGLNQPQFQMVDINNDGMKDLVVHDRTGGMLLPFINKGNNDINTFEYSPKYVSAFPKMENTWFLLVDYDKDGKEDLWTKINFRTVLFRNVTKPGDKVVRFFQTSEYLQAYNFSPPPFPDSSSVSCGNFNIPTIGDVDGDGDIDIFSYQADEGNLMLYRNMTADYKLPIHPPVFDLADFCWGDFRDTALDGIQLKGCPFKYYRKHGGGSTLLWFDKDNDGDMDLLMGNAGGSNLIYLKNGKKEFNTKLDSMVWYEGHWPSSNTPVALNSFPGAFLLDADGDGVKDILVAPNQYEKVYKIEETEQVLFYKNYGTDKLPQFKFEKKNYFTNAILDHGAYTAPLLKDIDGDFDLDLILATNGDNAKTADRAYRLILYRNIGSQTNPVFKLENEDLWGLSNDSLVLLSLTIGDLNGDNKPDLLAGNYYGDLYFYKNIGSTTTWAFTQPVKNYLNIRVGECSSPQLIDIDKNGLLDLVIGEKGGNFSYYLNTGNTSSPKFTLMDDTLGNFIVNEFSYRQNPPGYWYIGNAAGEIADLDNDGKFDMIFGGEEGKVRVMKFDNINQAVFTEDTTVLFDSAYMRYTTLDFGTRSRPAVGDVDGDGIKDVIVGNDRGGINFLKGTVKVTTIGFDAFKRNDPLVYPNPNNGSILNINKNSAGRFSFTLYDMSGKVVLQDDSKAGIQIHKINLNGLSDGLYTLESTESETNRYYTRISVIKGK